MTSLHVTYTWPKMHLRFYNQRKSIYRHKLCPVYNVQWKVDFTKRHSIHVYVTNALQGQTANTIHPIALVWAQRTPISLWDFIWRLLGVILQYTVSASLKLFPIGCKGLKCSCSVLWEWLVLPVSPTVQRGHWASGHLLQWVPGHMPPSQVQQTHREIRELAEWGNSYSGTGFNCVAYFVIVPYSLE